MFKVGAFSIMTVPAGTVVAAWWVMTHENKLGVTLFTPRFRIKDEGFYHTLTDLADVSSDEAYKKAETACINRLREVNLEFCLWHSTL